jgi:hypothetical protein
MSAMHSPSPIRRYVLLRHRDAGATAPRWSMERIAPAPRGTGRPGPAEQPVKRAPERG